MTYRRLIGCCMIALGLTIAGSGSPGVQYLLTRYSADPRIGNFFGVLMFLGGFLAALEPDNVLYGVFSLPLLLYIALIVIYALDGQAGWTGVITNVTLYVIAAAEALEWGNHDAVNGGST